MKIYKHKNWLELWVSMRTYIAIFRYGLEFRLFGRYYGHIGKKNDNFRSRRLEFRINR